MIFCYPITIVWFMRKTTKKKVKRGIRSVKKKKASRKIIRKRNKPRSRVSKVSRPTKRKIKKVARVASRTRKTTKVVRSKARNQNYRITKHTTKLSKSFKVTEENAKTKCNKNIRPAIRKSYGKFKKKKGRISLALNFKADYREVTTGRKVKIVLGKFSSAIAEIENSDNLDKYTDRLFDDLENRVASYEAKSLYDIAIYGVEVERYQEVSEKTPLTKAKNAKTKTNKKRAKKKKVRRH